MKSFFFLQHSCQPNVFVQNVFTETHDVRFPLGGVFRGNVYTSRNGAFVGLQLHRWKRTGEKNYLPLWCYELQRTSFVGVGRFPFFYPFLFILL